MTTLTADSDFEEAAGLPNLAVETQRLSASNNTSRASVLRGPRQLDDGKVPPTFHECDD